MNKYNAFAVPVTFKHRFLVNNNNTVVPKSGIIKGKVVGKYDFPKRQCLLIKTRQIQEDFL